MSLVKCLRSVPIHADDLAEIRELIKNAGDEKNGVSVYLDNLTADLEGLRGQLTARGFDVAPKQAEKQFNGETDIKPQSELPAATARLDRGMKVPDTTKAEIDRMVKDAKDEGFDPENNSHDLELDVEAMREQGLLTEADETALKVADENFGVAEAWETVMNVAKGCVIK